MTTSQSKARLYLKAKENLLKSKEACETLSIIYENHKLEVSIAYDRLSEEIETLLLKLSQLGQNL